MSIESWLASMPRTLLVCATVAIASQVGPIAATWPLLPAFAGASRSPSSDVLAQTLPLPSAGETLATLARHLPEAPGVIVVRGPAAPLVPAYYVVSTHLWPRPAMLVSCEPRPVPQFAAASNERRPIGWRIDLQAGTATPLRATTDPAALRPDAWCGDLVQ